MRILRRIAALTVVFCLCAAPASPQAETWHTYTDAAHGFAISYPDGWAANPNFTDKGYAFIQGDADDVRTGLGLSPVIDIAPGTTLESKSLVLAVQFARPGDACRARAFLADPSPDYVTQVDQDTPDAAHAIAEPGDLYSVEHLVRIVSHTPCIAVQIYLVYTRPGPREVKPPPPFDRAAVFALLSRIVGTLKPLK